MKTTFEDGTPITSYLATAFAEGFCEGEDASTEDQLRAWAYLIGTKMAYSLQGFFGRNASMLIERNIITPEGVFVTKILNNHVSINSYLFT
jgi:hypothetical protein